MRDARTLRTLLLLDLESHPPDAAIDRVCISVDPAPARDLQYSLLTRPLPPPEQLSTLMARLTALMGEGRCGSPAVVDSWAPGAYAMKRFEPGPAASSHLASRVADAPAVALRKFRNPVPARVRVEQSRPVSVGGAIAQCAGPWRTAGNWWTEQIWDRDEWDVMLSDGVACRVFRDRLTDAWFLDGIVD